MLIDASYFIGDINIPQLSQLAVKEKLDTLIQKYEPRLLRQLLGIELYDAFTEGLQDPDIEQRWIDLRDGKTYQYDGKKYLWVGLANPDKTSLIANYVYFQFNRTQAVHLSGVGAVITKAENAKRESPTEAMVYAWNEMVKWNWNLLNFIYANKDVYPEYAEKCPPRNLTKRINGFDI